MLFSRLLGVCLLWSAVVVHATTAHFPDYYTEPGIKQDQSYDSIADYEAIDPFGGTVKLHHVDLYLPGDGNADIKIERSYMTSDPDSARANETWRLGRGWTMHMGRLWRNSGGTSVCTASAGDSVDVARRLPVFESSDGVKRVLHYQNTQDIQNPRFRSLDGWSGFCTVATVNEERRFILYSPDGVRYEMEGDEPTTLFPDQDLMANVRRITYPSGNYIEVSYSKDSRGFHLMRSVAGYTASGADGRNVSFSYSYNDAFGEPRLSSMSSNGKIWTYSSSIAGTDHFLDSVTYPNGQVWNYGYQKSFLSSN